MEFSVIFYPLSCKVRRITKISCFTLLKNHIALNKFQPKFPKMSYYFEKFVK
jgi:hypothetical protein